MSSNRAIPRCAVPVRRTVLAGYFLLAAIATSAIATSASAAEESDKPKRGDEFLLFRETLVELPGGEKRSFDRGSRGRVIQVERARVVAMIERAKVTVPLDNIVAGRSGVARLTLAIREEPPDWLNYVLRGRLRRGMKDYEGAAKDLSKVPESAQEYRQAIGYLGLTYGDQGNWQAAVDCLSKSIELYRPLGYEKSIATMLVYRGAANYRLDKLDAARADLQEAIKLGYDEDAEAYLGLAKVLRTTGKHTEAVEVLKRAKEADPDDEKVRWALFDLYDELDQLDLALAEVNAVLKWKPDDLQVLSTRALLYINLKRLQEAQADIDRALAIKSDHPDALICKAHVLYDTNKLEELKSLCKRLVQFDLKGAEQLYLRAFLLAAADMDTEAFEDVNKVLEIDANHARALLCRARLHSNIEEWDRARADADAAIKLKPQQAEAYYWRAAGYYGLRNLDAALADLSQSILLNSTYRHTYLARADVLRALKRPEAALADLRTALGLDPDDEEAALEFTKLLAQTGQIDEALVHLTECIQRFENKAAYYGLRCAAWQKKREYHMVIADATESLLRAPGNYECHVRRAQCYLEIQQFEHARHDLEAAESISPLNPEGQYAVATLLELEGDYSAAMKLYDELLAIHRVKSYVHGRLARVFATAADAKYRDGKRAIEHAKTACELSAWKAAMPIAYLAAAHAESGDFAAAVEWQTKALAIADEKDREELAKQLELYKAGKPYRQTPVARVASKPK